MTAEELLKELNNNKEYLKNEKLKEDERLKNHNLLVKEYKMFSDECLLHGYKIETAWDLLTLKDSYSGLIPVLMKYLQEENHSEKYIEGIARALVVPESYVYFYDLLERYKNIKSGYFNAKWAIALAIAVSAQTKEQYNIIEQLIYNKELGEDRIAFLNSIKRMEKTQKQRIIDFAKNDDQLKMNLKFNK